MSRIKNFARGVVSGYVQMAANIVFTIASVPLALHYLSKSEFALWALVTQVTGYLALIDFGMSVSVARILADHKDERDGGAYGSILKAGSIVFLAQAIFLGLAAWLFAAPLTGWLQIEPAFRGEFILLLRAYALVIAFAFATKIAGVPFWGIQRYDVGNYANTAGFALQLGILWWGFAIGLGLRSMLIAALAATILSFIWNVVAGLRLDVYPRRGCWGRTQGGMLRELFAFGRDIFLMTVGAQLLSASQIIIVTRMLGLEAAATWAICSKIFALAQQAVTRIFETSSGAFAEMFVRGEHDRFKERFRDVLSLTASLSAAAGVIVAAVNPSFVTVWTHGRVAWPSLVDVLLGVLLFVTCVSRCSTGIAGITKQVRLLRFVFFFEGIAFVLLAWFAGARYGFAGMAASSIAATLMWSGAYGFIRTRRQWQCSTLELLRWLAPAARVLAGLLPAAILLRWWMEPEPVIWQLSVIGGSLSLIAATLIWIAGFPASLRREFSARLAAHRRAAV